MKYFVANYDTFIFDVPVFFDKEGHHILFLKKADKIYAIADKCPHMGVSLMKGSFEDGVVTCKGHGAKIDVTNGEVIAKPHIGFLKFYARKAQTYQVFVDNAKVYVEIE